MVRRTLADGKPGALRKARGAGVNSFERWRRLAQPELPPLCDKYDPAVAGREIMWWATTMLSKSKVRGNTISGYLSSVRRHVASIIGALPIEPVTFRDYLHRVRQSDPPSKPKAAATPRLLRAAVRHTPEPAVAAAIILQFHGMGRASAFAYPRRAEFDPAYDVTWRDVYMQALTPGGEPLLFINHRRGKTDTYNTGSFKAFAPTGDDLCPIAAIKALKQATQDAGLRTGLDDPVFVLTHRGRRGNTSPGRLLSVNDISQAVKVGAESIGLQPDDYGSHSIRAGAAKTAKDAGIPDSEIKIRGDWVTDCFLIYARTSPDRLRLLRDALSVGRVRAGGAEATEYERLAAALRHQASVSHPFSEHTV